jgi:hypothetical protein
MNGEGSQNAMSPKNELTRQTDIEGISTFAGKPLWELGINELAGRNLETAGRREVNGMLKQGWILLHIYTLRYPERENPRGPRIVWRERPMAILGRRSS